jgi:hypothetical protein
LISLDVIFAKADELIFSRRGPHVEGGKKAVLSRPGFDLRLERLGHVKGKVFDDLVDLIRVAISIDEVAVVEWDRVIPILNQGRYLVHPLREACDKRRAKIVYASIGHRSRSQRDYNAQGGSHIINSLGRWKTDLLTRIEAPVSQPSLLEACDDPPLGVSIKWQLNQVNGCARI